MYGGSIQYSDPSNLLREEDMPDPDRGTFYEKICRWKKKIWSKNTIYFFSVKTDLQAPEEASSPQDRAGLT